MEGRALTIGLGASRPGRSGRAAAIAIVLVSCGAPRVPAGTSPGALPLADVVAAPERYSGREVTVVGWMFAEPGPCLEVVCTPPVLCCACRFFPALVAAADAADPRVALGIGADGAAPWCREEPDCTRVCDPRLGRPIEARGTIRRGPLGIWTMDVVGFRVL
jgi:hypothetical protein